MLIKSVEDLEMLCKLLDKYSLNSIQVADIVLTKSFHDMNSSSGSQRFDTSDDVTDVDPFPGLKKMQEELEQKQRELLTEAENYFTDPTSSESEES